MRIGVATHNYPPHPGGLEAIAQNLARRLSRQHQVTVISTAWQDRYGVSVEEGVTVHRLPAWHGAEARGVPYALPLGKGVRAAHAALRACDVIHAHGSLYATTILGLAARRAGAPLIITEHVGFVHYPSRIVDAIERLAWTMVGGPLVRRAAAVVVYNSRVRDWLAARFGEQKVAFIPNGIDAARFRPLSAEERRATRHRFGLPQDDVLALFVGRAAGKKNLDEVLRFPARGYRLVVCGAERRMPAGVLDLGVVPHDDMPALMAATDFLLHAATGEGFPVAIQEAMAAGLPVVLLWDSGYEGSVDREALMALDTLDELAVAANDVAADPRLRERAAHRSRDYATRTWSWDTTVRAHHDLFRAAIEEAA